MRATFSSTRVLPLIAIGTAGLLAAAGLSAHDQPPGDHPGMTHFHIKGRVVNARNEGIGGATVGTFTMYRDGGTGTTRPIGSMRVGPFQLNGCTAETPPVPSGPDGRYDLVVYHTASPACAVMLHDDLPASVSPAKDGYRFSRAGSPAQIVLQRGLK